MKSQSIGAMGEKEACKFLKKKGFKIIERNYQVALGKILGEIDIIAREGETLVFVEVKTRGSEDFGSPCEFVTNAKQQRMIRTAYTYIMKLESEPPCRFDIIEVLHKNGKATEVRHIPHAFTL